jgi:hypothetical protein
MLETGMRQPTGISAGSGWQAEVQPGRQAAARISTIAKNNVAFFMSRSRGRCAAPDRSGLRTLYHFDSAHKDIGFLLIVPINVK